MCNAANSATIALLMTAAPDTRPGPDLLAAARAGEPEVWERIVGEFGPIIRGYARARGVSDADDLTQDVFTAAAQRIADFEGDWEAMRAWLFSIAYRQVVNRYRKGRARTESLPAGLVDPTRSPEDEVVERAHAGAAVAALEVLDDIERDVVLLRVLVGLDAAAVGRVIGKRPGNVRVIQFRALGKLREELVRRGYRSEEVS